MFMRRNPEITREELKSLREAAESALDHNREAKLATLAPCDVRRPIDEPANLAARRGIAALLRVQIDKGDLGHIAQLVTGPVAGAVLGRTLEPGSPAERMASRKLAEAARDSALKAAAAFDAAAEFKALPLGVKIIAEGEEEAPPEKACELMDARLSNEERLEKYFAMNPLVERIGTEAATVSTYTEPDASNSRESASAQVSGGLKLENEDKKISGLWPLFVETKVARKKWGQDEARSSRTTLSLWIEVEGDLVPRAYTTLASDDFLKIIKALPADYYHNKKFKKIYEEQGVRALVELTKDSKVERVSDKTWNKHSSRMNEFFIWCAKIGRALPPETPSIFKEASISIPKSLAHRRRNQARRIYSMDELAKLASGPPIMGCESERNWKTPGKLVFRNHRYWGTFLGMMHGPRREEIMALPVSQVKCLEGLWFFDLLDAEIEPLLKDVGSPRLIPMHDALIAIGFLEARVFGRNPEERLFPEVKSYAEIGGDAGPFGKWFCNYRRFLGINDPKLDFHALRHTLAALLKNAGVPQAFIDEILGHESEDRKSAVKNYDHALFLETLHEAINKLVLPIDIEAVNAAVAQSDQIDKSAAWPDLKDPAIVPKPRRKAE